jgi:hypothetical protein
MVLEIRLAGSRVHEEDIFCRSSLFGRYEDGKAVGSGRDKEEGEIHGNMSFRADP